MNIKYFYDIVIFSPNNFDEFCYKYSAKNGYTGFIAAMYKTKENGTKLDSGINMIASDDFRKIIKAIRVNRFELDNWHIIRYDYRLDMPVELARNY